MSDTLQAGPCVICGGTNYNLSCGGPPICPKCDCGNFDAATVETQAKVISSLRQEIERLRAALAATPAVGGEALIGTRRCTWPDCDQPSGHDFCYKHCSG